MNTGVATDLKANQVILRGRELKYMKADASDTVFVVNSDNANYHEMALTKSTRRLKLTVDSNGSAIQSENSTTGSGEDLCLQKQGGRVGIKTDTPNYALDVLYVVPDNGTYNPYPPATGNSPVFSTGTTSAVFQIGGIPYPNGTTGGKHGVAIGGDVMTGNGFIQSVYNDTNFGFNLHLQPSVGNVGIGNTQQFKNSNARTLLDVIGVWPQVVALSLIHI